MTEVLQLRIIDFDNLENREPLVVRETKLFCDDEKETAHYKLGKYLSTLTITPYLGWDNKVYPMFEVKRVLVE